MSAVRAAAAGLAFLLELTALAVLGFWGWRTGGTPAIRLVLAVAAPAAWAGTWAALFSPRPAVALPARAVMVGRLGMYALAVLALLHRGHPAGAAALATIVALDQLLIIGSRQPVRDSTTGRSRTRP